MNHQEASAAGMVERYILDELTPEERAAFEEHYFVCAGCAESVQAVSQLAAGIKAQPDAAAQAHSPPARRQQAPVWLAAAFGFLLCVSGYQNLRLLERVEAPYVANNPKTLRMGSRSSESAVFDQSGKPLLLFIDVPAESQWASYEIRVNAPAGGKAVRFTVAPAEAREAVPIVFPKEAVRAGTYTVDVYGKTTGGAAQRLQSATFTVK